jgi:leucyl-tRNA synthetase
MPTGRKQYPFDLIEPKWQSLWDAQQTFRAWNPGEAVPSEHPFARRHSSLPPKYYVLDMFPYPSGAGLHVGHPEGYTATDILARYRRAAGYNVLHPMGWDAFGLHAEQYAIKTGQHPRATTEANIATFKRQIKSLGFSYDWSRELDTTDPRYFKWTQWIFLKLYNSWFNPAANKAEPIDIFKDIFSENPQRRNDWGDNPLLLNLRKRWEDTPVHRREYEARTLTDGQRLAYSAAALVWWCEELGTVLANEEVIDGKSEVGGFPVVRKPMRQWMLRITSYAERLLNDLEGIDWSHSLKEMQRNWIGKSEGAEVEFNVQGSDAKIRAFTTRPDTLFGATYLVLAPEHPLIETWLDKNVIPTEWPKGTPASWKHVADAPMNAITSYQWMASVKSDLQRTDLAKDKDGVFTGVFAINPVNEERIPVFIADYVLASYGTGAIMAVPAHDERDFAFATKYDLPVVRVVEDQSNRAYRRFWSDAGTGDGSTSGYGDGSGGGSGKGESGTIWGDGRGDGVSCFCGEGISVNSANAEISLTGLPTAEAKRTITAWLESKGFGKRTINYKLRDWLFSRQRYWGEPFPIIWKIGHFEENQGTTGYKYHEALLEKDLPVLPPVLDDYKPTPDGEPPLARADDWVNEIPGATRETNTMPQWAGSCWYYLRYLDARNPNEFAASATEKYWMGTTGAPKSGTTPGVDLYVGGTEHAVLHLLYARFWHKVLFDLGLVSTPEPFFKLVNQGLILGEDGQKMSKSRGNVVNPDDILSEYGADAFRLYEMFLGPLEMVKPWSTKNVEGVYRFLGRVWRLFIDEDSETEFEQGLTAGADSGRALLERIRLSAAIREVEPTPAQLKTLHATIKKVTEDLDGLRFNTAISALMVFVNDAIGWDVKPVRVMRDFLTLLQPFAPHLAEELFSRLQALRNTGDATLAYVPWPRYDPALLIESTVEIAVQVNGKLRDKIVVAAGATPAELEAAALASDKIKPFIEGKTIKKVIVVPKRLVNIAVG